MLATARAASSTCSGLFTSDMALAVVCRTVNLSGFSDVRMDIGTVATWASRRRLARTADFFPTSHLNREKQNVADASGNQSAVLAAHT